MSVQIFHLSAPMIGVASFSVRRIVALDGFGEILKADTNFLFWIKGWIRTNPNSSAYNSGGPKSSEAP